MSNCTKPVSSVPGCYTSPTGKVAVVIHYTHHEEPGVLPGVRITDLLGNIIAGADTTNTTAGACAVASNDVEWKTLCWIDTNPATNNGDESPQRVEQRTTTTWDAAGNPTSQVDYFQIDRKTPVTVNEAMLLNCTAPSHLVMPAALETIAGATRALEPAFAGLNNSENFGMLVNSGQRLQSFTVSAKGVVDGPLSNDRVEVTLPGGEIMYLFNNQPFTWSVTKDIESGLVYADIRIEAFGNAYANIGYTYS